MFAVTRQTCLIIQAGIGNYTLIYCSNLVLKESHKYDLIKLVMLINHCSQYIYNH